MTTIPFLIASRMFDPFRIVITLLKYVKMSFCNACNLTLADELAIKEHYRTELHNLNSRRRAADLAPLTPIAFDRLEAAKAAQQQLQQEAEAEVIFICDACHKKFRSEGQFETHNASKKHKDTVRELIAARKAEKARAATAAAGADSEADGHSHDVALNSAAGASGAKDTASAESPKSADREEEDAELVITAEHCVFCWEKHDGIEGNLSHMRSAHSFFVPDIDKCEDPTGLIEYLHAKVIDGRFCLYCDSNKQFESPEAARQHMRDKNHCLMRYDDDRHFEEFEDFYNYAGSDDEAGEDEDEEVNVAGALAVGDGGAYIIDGELILPSGAVAKHRALKRYLKQNFRADDQRASVRAAMSRLALEYGPQSTTGGSRAAALAAAKNCGRGTRGNNVDIRAQRKIQDYHRRMELATGIRMNDIRTKHLRIQVIGAG